MIEVKLDVIMLNVKTESFAFCSKIFLMKA